ncbi:hypothetical protein SAY86_019943 [Trapa natans]|uniref:SF3A3 domain-containing protein n=1 Tax=Trapa natans TaxID=22666 RepID=A0AAN7LPS5_TRANT|nr:hypothetical protein SAY86_019943 [Trapa natans]
MIDTISTTTEKLIEICADKDGARKNVIAAFDARTATGTNYHRKHPASRVVEVNEDFEALLKEEPPVEFSGEEAMGRYLDMHELFYLYINSKFGAPIEYSAFCDTSAQLEKISRRQKFSKQYREYLDKLLVYLLYFFERTEPLQDLYRILSKIESEFEERWTNNLMESWKQGVKKMGKILSSIP